MTISEWLKDVSDELADAMVPTARLDAEIILAHTLGKPRTWLHAHGDEDMDARKRDIADARIELRLERVPVAYIIGHKEFYGRRFFVSPDTLIPRPESEAMIDALQELIKSNPVEPALLVDVGTGSGCLGITAKLLHPELRVTLTDTSKRALAIAEKNAKAHAVDVRLLESNLLDKFPLRTTYILANLPYVDKSWNVSAELDAEPALALYADDGGLALIKQLIEQAPDKLEAGGYLLLEADPVQHQAIIDYAKSHELSYIRRHDYCVVLRAQ